MDKETLPSATVWVVSYAIGDLRGSKEFQDRNEAQNFYDVMCDQAYDHEVDGGSDATVTLGSR